LSSPALVGAFALDKALGHPNIRDPIPFPTRKTRLLFLAVETDRLPTQTQRAKPSKVFTFTTA
jgi:hypothetical protein